MIELLPDDVYLDTGVVMVAIVPNSLYDEASRDFCERLIAQGCTVYFSQILRLELSEAGRKLATISGRVSADLRREYRLDDWERDVSVRRAWLFFMADEFELLPARFAEVLELPFDEAIWLRSVEVMAERQVRSHDAVHLATAYENRLTCFATTDDGLLEIPDLDVRLVRDCGVGGPRERSLR
jgi:predicted nucleic acid-binding protein